jgi:hypothetical protein
VQQARTAVTVGIVGPADLCAFPYQSLLIRAGGVPSQCVQFKEPKEVGQRLLGQPSKAVGSARWMVDLRSQIQQGRRRFAGGTVDEMKGLFSFL